MLKRRSLEDKLSSICSSDDFQCDFKFASYYCAIFSVVSLWIGASTTHVKKEIEIEINSVKALCKFVCVCLL